MIELTFTDLDDPAVVVDPLEAVLPLFVEIVARSLTHARTVIDASGLDRSAPLHASITRACLLQQIGSLPECKIIEEPNDGVHIRYGKFHVRFLKEPPPLQLRTLSTARRRYSQHLSGPRQLSFGFAEIVRTVSLFIYWDVNGSYMLNQLRLVCPGNPVQGHACERWSVDLLNYLANVPAVEADVLAEDEDLPIVRKPVFGVEDSENLG